MAPITKNTTVTVGLVLALIAGLVAGFGLLDSRFKDVGKSLGELGDSVTEITFSLREIRTSISGLEKRSNGMLSYRDFDAWVRLLQAQNPNLEIPAIDG